jgi:hypothetical protein
MTLIPWQVQAGAAVVAAGAIFGGGWTVESWRASGQLEAEKLKNQQDVAKLQTDWAANIEEANKIAAQAKADLDVERTLDQESRQNAEAKYAQDIAKRDAINDRLVRDAQRVRDELAAASAAASAAGGNGAVQQSGAAASCSGPSGRAICGLLSRAIDIAERCAKAAGQQHAAVVEAVDAWPKH